MNGIVSIAGRARLAFRKLLHESLAIASFAVHYVQLRLVRAALKRRDPARKIVIIDLIEHLGDIVACEPVARHIKETDPDAYLIWAVRKPYQELIDTNPVIDRTLVVFCLTEWILLSKTSLFDETVDLHIQGRVCPVCNIPLRKKTGDPAITLENYYHFGGALQSFTRSAGMVVSDREPRVYIPRSAERTVDGLGLPKRFIAVHCTSNEVSRDWTADKWIGLAERIFRDTDCSVVETGSRTMLEQYRHPRWTTLCGRTSILETAEIIRRAVLFVGVDSGPAHLANAVGTYGIILLGHYRAFTEHLPYSGSYASGVNAEIIREQGPAAAITVERVFTSIMQRVGAAAKRHTTETAVTGDS